MLNFLLESLLGDDVWLLHGFLEEWYLLFTIEQRNRHTLAEAKEHYDHLKNNPDYGALKHLACLQARLGADHFLKVSRFLEYNDWEVTNSGVERTGRAF